MPESKKTVIKLDIHDEGSKRKALKAVSDLSGIESLAMDMKDKKLTIVGDIDPVGVVRKLKKWHAKILTVGPAKEPGKKEPEKKGKEDEEKAKKEKQETEEAIKKWMELRKWMEGRKVYDPYLTQPYGVYSLEEDPNACVIC